MVRAMVLLTLAALMAGTGLVLAQEGVLPAPSPFSAGGAASSVPSPCMKDYVSLRDDAEKKRSLINKASARHAPPQDACKLIDDYSQAEVKIIRLIEANLENCAIPARFASELKAGHRNTEALQRRLCDAADQMQRRSGAVPAPFNDYGDPTLGRELSR